MNSVNVNNSQRDIKLIRCKCNAWKYPTQTDCKWCNLKLEQEVKAS